MAVNSLLGTFASNKSRSLRARLKLIVLIMSRPYHDMPHLYIAEQHPVINFGWANFFDVLPSLRQWSESPRAEFVELCKTPEKNPESSERDTAHLLYDLARLVKAKRIIEVGIYRGAGSLHLAQALSDIGGGELHLVDIVGERLAEVQKLITNAGLNVKSITHAGDAAELAKRGGLGTAELIFLDANHYYKEIYPEIVNYWDLVAEGGILVIHDSILFDGTRRRVNELFDNGKLLCTFASSLGAGISIIYKSSNAPQQVSIPPGKRGVNIARTQFDPIDQK